MAEDGKLRLLRGGGKSGAASGDRKETARIWRRWNNTLEARAGIEPANKGFADLCLTTWLPRHGIAVQDNDPAPGRRRLEARTGFEPVMEVLQTSALPLGYRATEQFQAIAAGTDPSIARSASGSGSGPAPGSVWLSIGEQVSGGDESR